MTLVYAATLTAAKSIANATDTLLVAADLTTTFDLPRDSWGERAQSWANGTLIVPNNLDGRLFVVRFHGAFANNATGIRAAKVLRNSTAVTTGSIGSDARAVPAASGEGSFDVQTQPTALAAGDLLRFGVFQNSGGALTLSAAIFGGVLTGVSLHCASSSWP